MPVPHPLLFTFNYRVFQGCRNWLSTVYYLIWPCLTRYTRLDSHFVNHNLLVVNTKNHKHDVNHVFSWVMIFNTDFSLLKVITFDLLLIILIVHIPFHNSTRPFQFVYVYDIEWLNFKINLQFVMKTLSKMYGK